MSHVHLQMMSFLLLIGEYSVTVSGLYCRVWCQHSKSKFCLISVSPVYLFLCFTFHPLMSSFIVSHKQLILYPMWSWPVTGRNMLRPGESQARRVWGAWVSDGWASARQVSGLFALILLMLLSSPSYVSQHSTRDSRGTICRCLSTSDPEVSISTPSPRACNLLGGKEGSCVNCRSHLICSPSPRGHCPSILGVQYIKPVSCFSLICGCFKWESELVAFTPSWKEAQGLKRPSLFP